ncbi:cytochrome c oxidase subunit II [Paenibacillus sediminis]|uniref:Cytochrome c oxidase subunit 2 n=1 Tax=Paenibacillus sediminis TaxID=664909 RepID=A0ABS4H7Q1_9BACL|nr:cytochrome c oxidase subunit II [Paenibacillus sediminis]MBP1938554.1 cytochrome c oxidase subunit 2 [Paenibacillus sediminis]
MMKRWQAFKRLLPLMASIALLLSACGREDLSALRPQGPVAQGSYDLMKLAISIMICVLLVVFGIATYVWIKFRRKKGQTEPPEQVEGNFKLEVIWTVIPLILVFILAVPTIQKVFAMGEDYTKDKNAVHVKVTSHQFWWEFEYPDYGVKTAQDLIIPTNKRISFQLKTADVLHSFWVPSLSGKIDTNPDGTINKWSFTAPKEGVYLGKCAELCGQSHALMEFKVKAVSPESFDRWVAAMKEPAKLPEDPQIAETFKNQCLTCHAVGDQGGPAAPNLTGIGGRETVASILINDESHPVKENLKKWISDPQKVKPGNLMPKVDLTAEQIDGIADYLANYKLNY